MCTRRFRMWWARISRSYRLECWIVSPARVQFALFPCDAGALRVASRLGLSPILLPKNGRTPHPADTWTQSDFSTIVES
jgi:hypothetical protein